MGSDILLRTAFDIYCFLPIMKCNKTIRSNMQQECRTCGRTFIFSKEEQQILKDTSLKLKGKIYELSTPKDCGECRMKHLLRFHNDTNLYKNTCVGSQKEILAAYHPDSSVKVMDYELWFSDSFAPLQYGRDYDFSRPFFVQFKELQQEVPRLNISVNDLENSPYVNGAGYIKDSYLVFNAAHDERCYYSYGIFQSDNCADMAFSNSMTLCYESIDCESCYNCSYIQNTKHCKDSYFLYDCRNCTSCIGCFGLRNKEYYVYNQPVSKEKYESIRDSIKNMSWHGVRNFQKKFDEYLCSYQRKYITGEGNEQSTGNYLNNCKDVLRSYALNNAENCFDSSSAFDVKDSISLFQWGERADHIYWSVEVGNNVSHVAMSNLVWQSSNNIYYSDMCFSSHDCFGSVGLKKNQYCILNKQYTKDEYEELVPKIIAHMQSTGEWGEFFPVDHSPFAYNESNAQLLHPLTKEEAFAQGETYREDGAVAQATCEDLPDVAISEIDKSIIGKVLCSEISGKPYRIIPQEYAFYVTQGIPISREHYGERMMRRFAMRTPEKLFHRECHECGVKLESSYETEKVLCEECYLERIL